MKLVASALVALFATAALANTTAPAAAPTTGTATPAMETTATPAAGKDAKMAAKPAPSAKAAANATDCTKLTGKAKADCETAMNHGTTHK